jgi:hypothetical protein
MNLRRFVWCLLPLLVVAARAQDGDSEEMITLSPFSISAEDDVGYSVSSAFAGTRLANNLVDPTAARRTPNVPVTLIKRADALAVSFSLVNAGDRQDRRNAELYASIESLRAEIGRVPGLHFEHREVRFASGNRSKISFASRSGTTTSYASVLVLADLPEGVDVVKQVKAIRDAVARATLQGQTKMVDGVVGLYVKDAAQHRREILDRIFADLDGLKKSLGAEFEVLPSGLNEPVRVRVCSETDVEFWIDYSFTIRSIRELTAGKKV